MLKKMGKPLKKEFKFSKKDYSWKKELDAFLASIINNKELRSGHLEDAVAVMSLIQNIYYSDREWRNKFSIKNIK